jgi:hypothetical protein
MFGMLITYPDHFLWSSNHISFSLNSAKEALRQCLPDGLRNHTFDEALKDDATTSRWLAQLLYNVNNPENNSASVQRSS